jgi:hypothetical protein
MFRCDTIHQSLIKLLSCFNQGQLLTILVNWQWSFWMLSLLLKAACRVLYMLATYLREVNGYGNLFGCFWQIVLLITSLIAVPWMLLPKPLVLRSQYLQVKSHPVCFQALSFVNTCVWSVMHSCGVSGFTFMMWSKCQADMCLVQVRSRLVVKLSYSLCVCFWGIVETARTDIWSIEWCRQQQCGGWWGPARGRRVWVQWSFSAPNDPHHWVCVGCCL